jgi:oleandomycin transport system ATP-binding protein
MMRRLVADGTTVLLTTQYIEEADRLADEIVVIDHGTVIAAGTSAQLKSRVGGHVLHARPAETGDLVSTESALAPLVKAGETTFNDGQVVTLPIEDTSALGQAVLRLEEAGVAIDDLSLRRPSLDEVFLALTGHVAEGDGSDDDEDRSDADLSNQRRAS